MAETLDLVEVSDGHRLGSMTLDKGKLTFEGDLPPKIVKLALDTGHSPEEVFEVYKSYSNGYLRFQPMGEGK